MALKDIKLQTIVDQGYIMASTRKLGWVWITHNPSCHDLPFNVEINNRLVSRCDCWASVMTVIRRATQSKQCSMTQCSRSI